MSSFQQALELQELLEQVGERIKDKPQGRSYLSPDNLAYVLAIGGDGATVMRDFMSAVGGYLMQVQHGRVKKEDAKAEVLRAFDEWLSKQKI